MKEFNYAPPQSAAETDPNAALQAQLDQATAKIAELKAEMEKFEKELFHTTQSVLSAINQQQRKASQQAAADYAQAKQSMLEELTTAQKKSFYTTGRGKQQIRGGKKHIRYRADDMEDTVV